MIQLERELRARLLRELVEPVGRALLAGDQLGDVEEFHEVQAPHRLRYQVSMKSGRAFNLVLDGPEGFAVESLRAIFEEISVFIETECRPLLVTH